MKKLFTIYLFMAVAITVNAQYKLSGVLPTYSAIGYNRYTNLNWEISYKFEKRDKSIYLNFYNAKVTVAPNSSYATPEKTYTKSELGVSVWPESNPHPSSLNVSVNCIRPDGKVELSGFSVSSDDYDLGEDWICAAILNGQELNLSAFKLSVMKASYNPGPVRELDDIINQKKSQKAANSSKAATQNSSSNYPLTTSQSSTTTNASTETPNNNLKLSDFGIPENTPTYTKKEATNQLITQAGSLAGELLNEWNAVSERKAQRLEAEYKAKISAEFDEKRRKEKTKFVKEFSPLFNQAEKGDENARMTLCFASKELSCEEFVPNKERWIQEAFANNNTDAILYKKSSYNLENIEYLEKNGIILGNVDAMVAIAMWYSRKTSYEGLIGGGNEQKALEWFNKAADFGSPNAMYFLGMIYKYGQITSDKYEQKIFIKFTVTKDEKLALDWFIKADQPNYKESIYSRSLDTRHAFLAKSSYYIYGARLEMYRLYKKGKIVADKAKAEEMKDEALILKYNGFNTSHTSFNYDKAKEKFNNIDRY
jgi:TPR repeat protein